MCCVYPHLVRLLPRIALTRRRLSAANERFSHRDELDFVLRSGESADGRLLKPRVISKKMPLHFVVSRRHDGGARGDAEVVDGRQFAARDAKCRPPGIETRKNKELLM